MAKRFGQLRIKSARTCHCETDPLAALTRADEKGRARRLRRESRAIAWAVAIAAAVGLFGITWLVGGMAR